MNAQEVAKITVRGNATWQARQQEAEWGGAGGSDCGPLAAADDGARARAREDGGTRREWRGEAEGDRGGSAGVGFDWGQQRGARGDQGL